ncbi:MAG TPA: DUF4430 domain-containing protein [Pirellulaceae bacterium]|nr:DUF4430 domain-containing protein [Pirellulaceae bacterium]
MTLAIRFQGHPRETNREADLIDHTANAGEEDSQKPDDIELELVAFSGETVLDLLVRVMSEGTISFEATGQGETAFVHAIGGVRNRGASGPNWTYRINGELVKKSCGAATVAAEDHIEWVYGPVQMN